MVNNHDKCDLHLSSHEDANIQIANVTIKSSTSKELLGVTIGNNLKFDSRVENTCQKAGKKLNALARLVNCMDLPKRCILLNAFFNAQSNYYPTIWMFHSHSLNNNRLHERCLRMICNDKQSNLKSNWSEVILSLYIIKIFNVLQFKCIGLLMAFFEI